MIDESSGWAPCDAGPLARITRHLRPKTDGHSPPRHTAGIPRWLTRGHRNHLHHSLHRLSGVPHC